jgi:uncharacterized protein (DUF927 family)
MEKVFIVVELYTLDGSIVVVKALPFLDKQKATDEVKKAYIDYIEEYPEKFTSDDYYKDIDLDNGYFAIYKEGDFADDGCKVLIQEQEVK